MKRLPFSPVGTAAALVGLLALFPLMGAAATRAPDNRPALNVASLPEPLHLRLPMKSPPSERLLPTTMDLMEEGELPRSLHIARTLRVPVLRPDGLPDPHAFEWVVTIPPQAHDTGIRRFHLMNASAAPDMRPRLHFDNVDENSLGLWEGTNRVFVYRHGVIQREGIPADRARSTYLHPLFGLDGEVLTDDFPADHHHHRGLFWAWPHVGVSGKTYDLWALSGIEQRFERWLGREASVAGAVLGVENGWYVGNNKVMTERLWFTVYPETLNRRAIDLVATWIPASEPVTLAGAEGKSYGGLTLRYAPRTETVITTPLGNGTNDLYMTRLPWADLSARFRGDAASSGASVFVAPDHPDHPPTWLTRHYGVLCLGWPGVQPQTLEPEVPVRCRYRVWIHRGSPAPDVIQAAYNAYTNGLTATLIGPSLRQLVTAVQEPDRIRVHVSGRPFTEYHFSPDSKLPHFHPILGPRSDRSVTAKEAEPYPHHAGLWFGCDRVNEGNYWQEGPERGRIRTESIRLVPSSVIGAMAEFEQSCVWERTGAEPPLRDVRRIRITAPSENRRVIEFDISLTALTDVRIEKSNHSLFAVRMAPDLAVTGGGRLINAAGDSGEAATFGKASLWMDARGPRGEAITEGLALFPHPENPGHPVPWFTRDYGFFSPTPMYWLENGEHSMAKGETVRLRYRVLVHADAPTFEELEGFAVE